MSLVRFENITKSFAGSPVLERVAFRIEEGEKVGLIGRNGTGKSTILKLITGDVEPESGVIERMRKSRMAYLAQLPQLDQAKTLLDTIMGVFAPLVSMENRLAELEHEMAERHEAVLGEYSRLQDEFTLRGGYTFRSEAKRVLQGLGFGPADFDRSVCTLSGGQTTRLMLALVLVQESDLLLLDEPENHLDIEAREWLEAYLKECAKAVVMVSHDRQILNTVATRIVEVERGSLDGFTGNYDAYAQHKAVVRGQQQKAFERQQEFIRKEEGWIDRFRYKNTKARQVQGRIKRLEKLDRIDAPPPEAADTRFTFGEVVRSGQLVLRASRLSMRYGDHTLYDDLSFELHRGERVGVVGPNGSGKTTLVQHLAGRLGGGQGEVSLGHKVSLGLYDQRHEGLNPGNDILAEVRTVRPDMLNEQLRTFLGRLLFTGEDVFKPISALSGGELARVAIAKLILGSANCLLLDEPTNHLDIASREALETALAGFPGTLLVVSHDRALIDRLVDRLIVIENGHASFHLGNYADYRWKKTQRAEEAAAEARAAAAARKPKAPRADRTEQNRLRKLGQKRAELEQDIEALEARIQELEAHFAQVDPTDFEQVQDMKREYAALRTDVDELYAEWDALADLNPNG